jgi:hypothetical protein
VTVIASKKWASSEFTSVIAKPLALAAGALARYETTRHTKGVTARKIDDIYVEMHEALVNLRRALEARGY